MTTSRDELRRAIADIRSQKIGIGDLPQRVHDWHGHIVKVYRGLDVMTAIPTFGLGPAMIEDFGVDRIWENRDKINTALGETWRKLDEMDPGLEVPVTFLEYADEWRNIMGTIDNAGTAFSETDLMGEWKGDAAGRFRSLRPRHEAAFKSMSSMCEEIAKSLETVAAAELKLYSDLATHTQDLVEKVTDTIGGVTGTFFNVPWGPISASMELVSVVEAANTFILGITKSVADSAFENTKEANHIAQVESVQRGIPGNKWPPAVVASYGHGKEGVIAAIGDATTQDGDKSDWSL